MFTVSDVSIFFIIILKNTFIAENITYIMSKAIYKLVYRLFPIEFANKYACISNRIININVQLKKIVLTSEQHYDLITFYRIMPQYLFPTSAYVATNDGGLF